MDGRRETEVPNKPYRKTPNNSIYNIHLANRLPARQSGAEKRGGTTRIPKKLKKKNRRRLEGEW
jgi:hypothetical protein